MRFFFDSSTNTIRTIETYSKSIEVDLIATQFLIEIDLLFKQYVFSNIDLKLFELKNKDEFDTLNKRRIDFINYLCKTQMIHPSMFVESELLKKYVLDAFGTNADIVYNTLLAKAREINSSIQNILVDSDPRTANRPSI